MGFWNYDLLHHEEELESEERNLLAGFLADSFRHGAADSGQQRQCTAYQLESRPMSVEDWRHQYAKDVIKSSVALKPTSGDATGGLSENVGSLFGVLKSSSCLTAKNNTYNQPKSKPKSWTSTSNYQDSLSPSRLKTKAVLLSSEWPERASRRV